MYFLEIREVFWGVFSFIIIDFLFHKLIDHHLNIFITLQAQNISFLLNLIFFIFIIILITTNFQFLIFFIQA